MAKLWRWYVHTWSDYLCIICAKLLVCDYFLSSILAENGVQHMRCYGAIWRRLKFNDTRSINSTFVTLLDHCPWIEGYFGTTCWNEKIWGIGQIAQESFGRNGTRLCVDVPPSSQVVYAFLWGLIFTAAFPWFFLLGLRLTFGAALVDHPVIRRPYMVLAWINNGIHVSLMVLLNMFMGYEPRSRINLMNGLALGLDIFLLKGPDALRLWLKDGQELNSEKNKGGGGKLRGGENIP